MTRALVLLGGILYFKMALPRRNRYGRHKPYGSALDVSVPDDISCSLLCDPELAAKVREHQLRRPGSQGPLESGSHGMLGP